MSHVPTTPDADAETRQAWDSLWATGVADTFGHAGDGDSPPPPLATSWMQWFGGLPRGTHLLDLATGNGALPRLMLLSNAHLTCDAVDLASQSPAWLQARSAAQRASVRFHAGVRCEQLPFPAGSFDGVVSQFGIEYANLDQALPEALRVLKPGGQLRFAVHHPSGLPARLAEEEIHHARWLLDGGWLPAAKEMAQAMSLMAHPAGRHALNAEPRWQAVRTRFDEQQHRLNQRAAASSCPDLLQDAQGWLVDVFRAAARQGEDAAQAGIAAITRMLRDGELRLRDLLAHTLDEQRVRALVQAIGASGRRAAIEPAWDGKHLMGWWVTA